MLDQLNLGDPTVQQVLVTFVVIVAVAVFIRLGKSLVSRTVDDPTRQFRVSKALGRTLATLGLIIVLSVWSVHLGSIATLLTVIGAGLAIALREVLLGLVGSMLILLRRLYEQGDRIEVGGIKGDVLDIRLQFTILMEVGGWVDAEQSTGRVVHLPNSYVLQHPVYNYTRGFRFIWVELPFTVTFRSNWKAAQEIMLRYANESAAIVERQAADEIRSVSHEFLIHFSIMTPFVYVRVVENGVRLTLRLLVEARKRRGMEHALTVSILDDFRRHGQIELAYPMVGVAELVGPQFAASGSGTLPHAGMAPDAPEGEGAKQ